MFIGCRVGVGLEAGVGVRVGAGVGVSVGITISGVALGSGVSESAALFSIGVGISWSLPEPLSGLQATANVHNNKRTGLIPAV
jgi:hypothetical protein